MIKAYFIQKSLFWVITDTRTVSRREYGHGIASQTRWKFNSSRPKRRILDEFRICVRTKIALRKCGALIMRKYGH